jgi:uncharacterized membrane protein YgcG
MPSLDEFKLKIQEILNVKKYGSQPLNQAVPAQNATGPEVNQSLQVGPTNQGNNNTPGVCLFQEEGEEDPDAAELDQIDQELNAEEGGEDPNATEPPQEQPEETPDQPEEAPQDNQEAPPAAPAPHQNDNQKVQEMFKDTGQPEVDYSLSNENNLRLYKFKFTYAGINVDDLMKSDEEKKGGLTRKELESRLSPEQLHYYNDKWQKLRDKFPQIAQREKNVIIHNANIMLLVNDKNGEEIPLPEAKRIEAYKKIFAMMDKKFGDKWQDLPEALNFLKNIKINFSKEKPVRNNLMSIKVIQEKDSINGGSLIPFNKIYIEVPQSVQNFIRVNQETEIYNNSSIYQALSSDFKEADRTVGTMDAIIKGKPTEDEANKEGGEGGGDEGGDSGGGGGGGMGDLGGGGGDMGGGETPDLLDLGPEGEAGADTGDTGDTGDTSGGEEKTDTGEETDTAL